MEYRIHVKHNAGSVVVSVEGDLPDGEHIITGTDNGHELSLHAERRSELGRYMIHTEHTVNRKQHAQAAEFPALAAIRDPDR